MGLNLKFSDFTKNGNYSERQESNTITFKILKLLFYSSHLPKFTRYYFIYFYVSRFKAHSNL